MYKKVLLTMLFLVPNLCIGTQLNPQLTDEMPVSQRQGIYKSYYLGEDGQLYCRHTNYKDDQVINYNDVKKNSVDKETFKDMMIGGGGETEGCLRAKDKNFVYYDGEIVDKLDTNTIEKINDCGGVADFKDKNYIINGTKEIKGFDATTFKCIQVYYGNIIGDKRNSAFVDQQLTIRNLPNVPVDTISFIDLDKYGNAFSMYFKSNNDIYFLGEKILAGYNGVLTGISSLSMWPGGIQYLITESSVFCNNIETKLKPSTFEIINTMGHIQTQPSSFSTDGSIVYYKCNLVNISIEKAKNIAENAGGRTYPELEPYITGNQNISTGPRIDSIKGDDIIKNIKELTNTNTITKTNIESDNFKIKYIIGFIVSLLSLVFIIYKLRKIFYSK